MLRFARITKQLPKSGSDITFLPLRGANTGVRLWFAKSWTTWNGISFRPGREARTQIVWDGRIVSFPALTRYWITSGRGIRANAVPGIKSIHRRTRMAAVEWNYQRLGRAAARPEKWQ